MAVVPATQEALVALVANRTVAAIDSPSALARALVLEWAMLRQAGMWEVALQAAQEACAASSLVPEAWSALGYSLVQQG